MFNDIIVTAERLIDITIKTAAEHERDNKACGDTAQAKEYEKFIGWMMELKDMKTKTKIEVN